MTSKDFLSRNDYYILLWELQDVRDFFDRLTCLDKPWVRTRMNASPNNLASIDESFAVNMSADFRFAVPGVGVSGLTCFHSLSDIGCQHVPMLFDARTCLDAESFLRALQAAVESF